jgi:hypothetical protein
VWRSSGRLVLVGEVGDVDGGEVESFGAADGADLDAVVGFAVPVGEGQSAMSQLVR